MSLTTEANTLALKLHETSASFAVQVKQYLQDSRYLILNEQAQWPFLEAEGDLTTVADQSSYSLVTDFGVSNLRKITSLRDANGNPIKLVTIEELDSYRAAEGSPRKAAGYMDTVRLWPTPNTIEMLSWKGQFRAVDLADGDSPEWENAYNPLWRLGAEAMGLDFLDDERAAQKYAIFYNKLKTMFGDNPIEDEEVQCDTFSSRSLDVFPDYCDYNWPL